MPRIEMNESEISELEFKTEYRYVEMRDFMVQIARIPITGAAKAWQISLYRRPEGSREISQSNRVAVWPGQNQLHQGARIKKEDLAEIRSWVVSQSPPLLKKYEIPRFNEYISREIKSIQK